MAETSLERIASPILHHLSGDNVTELVINAPGVAFLEKAGEWIKLDSEDFGGVKINKFIAALDSYAKGDLQTKGSSLLSTTLPSGERIQVVVEPSVENFAIAIRKPGTIQLTLDDYAERGAFDQLTDVVDASSIDEDLNAFLERGDTRGFIEACVVAKKTIVISGGTSTGKTTFFNALAKVIPADERLITIEDAREINLDQPNKLHLISQRSSEKNTFLNLLEACLRLRPDRILAAELRGAEAFTFLRSVNTGHPGSITTIHANSTIAARSQLSMMVAQAQLDLEPAAIERYIDQCVDVFVQLVRQPGGNRVVSEIDFDGKLISRQK